VRLALVRGISWICNKFLNGLDREVARVVQQTAEKDPVKQGIAPEPLVVV
jgi:hypothetical protein